MAKKVKKVFTKREILKLVNDKVDEFGKDCEGDSEYNALFSFPSWLEKNFKTKIKH